MVSLRLSLQVATLATALILLFGVALAYLLAMKTSGAKSSRYAFYPAACAASDSHGLLPDSLFSAEKGSLAVRC
jgi:hypothetical protein